MSSRKYELLLASVIAARATSFIFTKMSLASLDTFNLLALRFLSAFILLLIIFPKRVSHITKQDFLAGCIVGLMYFLVMSCELTALHTADTTTVSLLENCSIIFVPLFGAILAKKLPAPMTICSAVMALTGVFCLGAQIGSFTIGMFWGLMSALLYAAAILITDRVAHRDCDSLCIGIAQVGSIAVYALIASFIFEQPRIPTDGGSILMILELAIVCTGFGFTLQPVAQSRVSADRAGLFCAINPAIATLLGAVVLHEKLGLLSIIGLVLIVSSIALPYLKVKNAKDNLSA